MIKKKTTYGFGTKLILTALFLIGLLMVANLAFLFEETEEIEGIVEHTYNSRSYNSVAKMSSKGAPMCRVVWYDKEGEKVIYGMPNDKAYEVGDSYFLEVDVDTNRIPKHSVGEVVVAVIIGLIICVICIVNWRIKFGSVKPRPVKEEKTLSRIEKKRREVYNQQDYIPIVRCSICNGEKVAGFKDKKTGQFTEIMLIQKEEELEVFKQRYGVEDVKKEY